MIGEFSKRRNHVGARLVWRMCLVASYLAAVLGCEKASDQLTLSPGISVGPPGEASHETAMQTVPSTGDIPGGQSPASANPAAPPASFGPAAAGNNASASAPSRYGGNLRKANPERKGMSSQQIAEIILEGKDATPQDVTDFLEACAESAPGRELLIKVAARAVEICPPTDYALVDIANGLLEYAFENSDVPALEPTVGLIEAVANAEDERHGVDAGDAIYVAFTRNLLHSRSAHYMTGKVRLNSLGQRDQRNLYFLIRQNREDLVLMHLDYERLARGMVIALKEDPENLSLSAWAVDLGWQTRNKDLARAGVRYFDNHPEYADPAVKHGDFWAKLDWAKAP